MNILIVGAGVMAHYVKDEIINTHNNLIGMVDYFNSGDFNNFNQIKSFIDVIIDFSNKNMIKDILNYATNNKIPLLIATTGYDEKDNLLITEASKQIPIVKATNTSIGVNAMNKLVKYASEILKDFDIEIIEKHHNRKVDAPSGTAKTLFNILNEKNEYEPIFNRHKENKNRNSNEIGIHSIRAGNIVGEHSVIFSKDDEIIEIKHTALSRKIFASGSIKIANFLYKMKKENKKGLFKVSDIL